MAQLLSISSLKFWYESIGNLSKLVNKYFLHFCAFDCCCILDVMPLFSLNAPKTVFFKMWTSSLKRRNQLKKWKI